MLLKFPSVTPICFLKWGVASYRGCCSVVFSGCFLLLRSFLFGHIYLKDNRGHRFRAGASLQKLPNSEILSYLEIGRHLGVLILQKEVS